MGVKLASGDVHREGMSWWHWPCTESAGCAGGRMPRGDTVGAEWTRICPTSSSQGWAESASDVTGKGDSGWRPLRDTKMAHGMSPSPVAAGTGSSHLLPPSQHPKQARPCLHVCPWGG